MYDDNAKCKYSGTNYVLNEHTNDHVYYRYLSKHILRGKGGYLFEKRGVRSPREHHGDHV